MSQIGHKINIRGISGSGKTTFARSLGEVTGYRVIHLDELFWLPNWTESNRQEFKVRIAAELTEQPWIVDGNYSSVDHAARTDADTVIWLDFPFPIVFWRILTRSIWRAHSKTEIFPGCVESYQKAFFSSKSIILWSISNWGRARRNAKTAMAMAEQRAQNKTPGPIVYRLTSPLMAEEFLGAIADDPRFSATSQANSNVK